MYKKRSKFSYSVEKSFSNVNVSILYYNTVIIYAVASKS